MSRPENGSGGSGDGPERGGDAPGAVLADAPERSRYEARLPDAEGVGAAYYRFRDDTIVFTHTELPGSMQGRGVGSALARFALDDARRRGLAVLPWCPFMAGFIRRHPAYADLVPPDARERHGIPEPPGVDPDADGKP